MVSISHRLQVRLNFRRCHRSGAFVMNPDKPTITKVKPVLHSNKSSPSLQHPMAHSAAVFKIKYIFLGYSDPELIFLDNRNK